MLVLNKSILGLGNWRQLFLELEWGTLHKLGMYTGALLVSALYTKLPSCSPAACKGSLFLSSLVSGQWLEFYLKDQPSGSSQQIISSFFESITTAVPRYGCVINVGFNVGIEVVLRQQCQQCTLVRGKTLLGNVLRSVSLCVLKFVVYNCS